MTKEKNIQKNPKICLRQEGKIVLGSPGILMDRKHKKIF